MPRRKERTVGVLQLVVPWERETDTLGATLLAALTNELPARSALRVDLRREVANPAVHLSEQLAHGMVLKSWLA